jgi:L-threonylcarbamoyladenylate synthase
MQRIDTASIAEAAGLLQAGRLVAFPTETVYGLGANARDDAAVASIYQAKGRPSFNPLIVHVASAESAQELVQWSELAQQLAAHFWPGPLTMVLPRLPDCPISLLASAGMDTLAIRCPAHPLAQALLQASGLPLAAPSANRSGRISPTNAAHVREEFGGLLGAIIDGGDCRVGIESTIVMPTDEGIHLLRHGSITREQLEDLAPVHVPGDGRVLAPGMLKSHYAPRAQVRLNATHVEPGEALLAFGTPLEGATLQANLSPQGKLEEAAANLFRLLRELDAQHPHTIAVMPIPPEGLGAAINDRLARAAAERY